MVELTKAALTLVSEARATAQKDNDLVYNAVVPSEASLPPIEKNKDVAEPIPIHDVYAAPDVQKVVGPDLFARLVPLSVTESASMYSEEQAKLVRGEAEKVDLADTELVAALEYMGLPGSLERFGQGAAGRDDLTDPGAQVRAWAEELKKEEGEERVDDLFRKLAGLKERASKELETSSRDLDVEARECEMMRGRFAHLWEQTPSSSLTRSFRQDLRSHRESLEQASASDVQAQRLWEGVRRDVVTLLDREALRRAFVEALGTSGAAETSLLDADFGEDEEDEIKKRVKTISEALSKLSKIKKERTDVLKDLKERVRRLSSSTQTSAHVLCRSKTTTSPTSSSRTAKAPPASTPPSLRPSSRSSALTKLGSPRRCITRRRRCPRSAPTTKFSARGRRRARSKVDGARQSTRRRSSSRVLVERGRRTARSAQDCRRACSSTRTCASSSED